MKIAIITDAWRPQVNGVVRTLESVNAELRRMGHEVLVISSEGFRSFPCPTYPEIRLVVGAGRGIARRLDEFRPDAIHIPVEGPLGLAARRYCTKRGLPFTTSYHTCFPEYVNLRTGVPKSWTYRFVRWFHRPSQAVLAATPQIVQELQGNGVANVQLWTRGVDTSLFRSRPDVRRKGGKPVHLYVGRIAVEKNLEAFLKLDTGGDKILVGDGPDREKLAARYPDATFAGVKQGEELARYYAAADVFVFPSLTDTFGLVMLEALASGVPVAAYPVKGPIDVIGSDGRGTKPGFSKPIGALDDDLSAAVRRAETLSRDDCRAYACLYSWRYCAEEFLGHLAARAAEFAKQIKMMSAQCVEGQSAEDRAG